MPNQKINFQIPVVGGAFNTRSNEDDDVRVIYPVAGHFVSTSFIVSRVMARRQRQSRWLDWTDRWEIFTFLEKYRRIYHAHPRRKRTPPFFSCWQQPGEPTMKAPLIFPTFTLNLGQHFVVVVVGVINKRLTDTYPDPTNTNRRRYTILTQSCQSKNQLWRKWWRQ